MQEGSNLIYRPADQMVMQQLCILKLKLVMLRSAMRCDPVVMLPQMLRIRMSRSSRVASLKRAVRAQAQNGVQRSVWACRYDESNM